MINGCRDIRETIDMSIDTVDLDFDNYYENYLKLVERMEKIYPNQPFSFRNEDLDRLDDVLINHHYGLVYYTHTCSCWKKNNHPPPTQFIIENKDGRHITYRDFYDAVVKNWKTDKSCNHNLLEIIEVKHNCISLFISA
jgi:hypothetical protein